MGVSGCFSVLLQPKRGVGNQSPASPTSPTCPQVPACLFHTSSWPFPDCGWMGLCSWLDPFPPCSHEEGQLVWVYGMPPALYHFILMTTLRSQSLIPIFSGPETATKRGGVLPQRLTTCKWQQNSDPGFPGSKTHDLSGTVWWLRDSGVILFGGWASGLHCLTVCRISSIPRCVILRSVTSSSQDVQSTTSQIGCWSGGVVT